MNPIIAEIAARYGVNVAPDATYQHIPRGVSGEPPEPIGKGKSWRDNNGSYSAYHRNRKHQAAAAKREAIAKPARPDGEPSYAAGLQVAHAARSASFNARCDTIKRMADAGATPQAIADATGLQMGKNLMGLASKLCPSYGARYAKATRDAKAHANRTARAAKYTAAMDGCTVTEAAAKLGITRKNLDAAIYKLRQQGYMPR